MHSLNLICNILESVNRLTALEDAIELMSNTSPSQANCQSLRGVSIPNGHSVRTICLLKCLLKKPGAQVLMHLLMTYKFVKYWILLHQDVELSFSFLFSRFFLATAEREQTRKVWVQLWSRQKLIKAKQKKNNKDHEEIN